MCMGSFASSVCTVSTKNFWSERWISVKSMTSQLSALSCPRFPTAIERSVSFIAYGGRYPDASKTISHFRNRTDINPYIQPFLPVTVELSKCNYELRRWIGMPLSESQRTLPIRKISLSREMGNWLANSTGEKRYHNYSKTFRPRVNILQT